MGIGDFRDRIAALTVSAISAAQQAGELGPAEARPLVEIPRDPGHGDFSSNVAMNLAKPLRKKPREIAEIIARHAQISDGFLAGAPAIEGPGFINYRIADLAWQGIVKGIVESGEKYGSSNIGAGEKVMVEFVSANPTGPLHIGHARGAAFGDCMARLLTFTGHDVVKEFYVNDAGKQVDILAKTVHARFLEAHGVNVDFQKVFGEAKYYPGDYVREIAAAVPVAGMEAELLATPAGSYNQIERDFAVKMMLDEIQRDLADFGVTFDIWFRESQLYSTNAAELALNKLKDQGDIYEKDGAMWFKVSRYQPEEEDRVIRKSSGEWTYFASDITYHRDKLDRGFKRLINIWGADHHGYIGRVKAALQALGFPQDHLQVLLVQMVNLVRGGEPVRMGKRTGEFVTLREVLDEVGKDAMRFMFLTRSSNSHLDFDIDELKMKPGEDSEAKMSQLREKNPVYYVQYAFARTCAIFRKAAEVGIDPKAYLSADYSLLVKPEEIDLARKMERFPREVAQAATDTEPHRLSHYLLDLVGDFHRYYYRGDKDKDYRIIHEDRKTAAARLALVKAVSWVIRNGLYVLGVESPERM